MADGLYIVEKVSDDNRGEWEELIADSSQNTPFIRDDYLDIVGFEAKRWMVYRKGKPYSGICIPVSKTTGKPEGIVPYAPYQGLIYATSKERYTDYHNNLESTEILLDHLYESGEMEEIAFGNCFTVKDIRAVQWHHYHEPEKGMYNINVWFTAVKALKSAEEVEISKRRMRDLKHSQEKYGIVCDTSSDTSLFIDLYKKTFSRQGILLDEDDIDTVKKLTELIISKKLGELWYAHADNGEIIDATVFVYGNKRGYYLFGANDPEKRTCGGATMLFVEQLKWMKQMGIEEFDFIGINSPQRGDYKLSFESRLAPYYECMIKYR